MTFSLLIALLSTTAWPATATLDVQPNRPPMVNGPVIAPPSAAPVPAAALEVYTVDVEFRAGTQMLWRGSLRLATGRRGRYVEERSEGPLPRCELDIYSTTEHKISIVVDPLYRSRPTGRVQVYAQWQRPIDNSCRARPEPAWVRGEIALPPGVWQTMRGDDGLVLRLRRRN